MNNKAKVMVFGTFDILHKGHRFFLQSAKNKGDQLIVVIARDVNVGKFKGMAAVHDENKRKENIEALNIADRVIQGDEIDCYSVIESEKPDIICLGYDQNSFSQNLKEKLNNRDLHPKIIRLEAYEPHKYKSSKIRADNLNHNEKELNIAVIVSKKDPAGMNIKECLIENSDYGFSESKEIFDGTKTYKTVIGNKKIGLYTLEGETVYADELDKRIKADAFIFATKHQSAAKKPSLTIHTPGNFGKAELGGKDRMLSVAAPVMVKTAFMILDSNYNKSGLEGHDISLEATHHGPCLSTASMFIEIGSDHEEWINSSAGKVIAETIMDTVKGLSPDNAKKFVSAIAFGGTHYCSNFNGIMLHSEYAIGHVCAKYAMDGLDKAMVKQMIERSCVKPTIALIDWKGLGKNKEKLLSILHELEFEYKKTRETKKTF
ncbi:MAG: adenylyltransferase/cytidyltransferase family protein [Nanoarchaeota archaeon]|nr:adenylyltransferase/cytidyltransferase family protein [Nanoarchaeota archaeon]